MFFWSIATAITVIACAALYYAAGRRMVNAVAGESHDPNNHFRLVLAEIDADLKSGKLAVAEADAAKGELAREILRHKAEAGGTVSAGASLGRMPLLVGLGAVAVVSFGTYAMLGQPDLPAQPLAGRTDTAAQALDLESAVQRIEAALAANPEDLRGWSVVAPAYMELGRFAEAARAYRHVIELSDPTPDLRTRLAEALLSAGDEASAAEAMTELRSAAASDPQHVPSRLYIAAELMRQQDYPAAAEAWNAVLSLSQGDEPWLNAARQGLATAEAGGEDPEGEQKMIGQMVTGLAERLASEGGSVQEWTQLVRSYLVLGDKAGAQEAYDQAVTAYPQTFDRGELDTLALGAGLTLNGAKP